MHVTSSDTSHLFSLAPQLRQIVDLTAAAKMKTNRQLTAANRQLIAANSS